MESIIYKKKLSAIKIVAILIAIVGVVILSYVKSERASKANCLESFSLSLRESAGPSIIS
jgi:EamA domain-containing membrane protein RarD